MSNRHVVKEKSVTAFEEEELGGSRSLAETEATGFTTCPVILLTRPPPTPTKRTGNNSECTTGNQQLRKRHSFSAYTNQNQLLGKFPGGLDPPGWWARPATKLGRHRAPSGASMAGDQTPSIQPALPCVREYKIQRPTSLYAHRSTTLSMCQKPP